MFFLILQLSYYPDFTDIKGGAQNLKWSDFSLLNLHGVFNFTKSHFI